MKYNIRAKLTLMVPVPYLRRGVPDKIYRQNILIIKYIFIITCKNIYGKIFKENLLKILYY